MRILFVFPHPDDESFGAGAAIAAMLRGGHEVFLLTLTKGGATRRRHDFGHSVAEMGEVRFGEMLAVEKALGLSGMTVLDLPDSGLKEMDPREIEAAVRDHVRTLGPQVLVTYAVHGISGFHDHLVSHAVVKRVFCEMRGEPAGPRRLALFTMSKGLDEDAPFQLSTSTEAEIDLVVETTEADRAAGRRALACYETYRTTIEAVGVDALVPERVSFELFQESHAPPLKDIGEALPGAPEA